MTLGVLTKADFVEAKDLQTSWLGIINNVTRPLKHGYYVTRLGWPEEPESISPWESIRKKERRFFNEAPWSQISSDRLGTERLTEALSKMLHTLTINKFASL
jgi:hypothetical protein